VSTMDASYLEGLRNEFEQSNFWRFLGTQIKTLEEGYAVIVLPPSPNFLNVNQGIHGGVIVSLLDSAMGLTLRSTEQMTSAVTQSLTTQFLWRPMAESNLFATGEIVRKGRKIVSMQGRVTDDDDRLIAVSLATFMSLDAG